MTTGGQKRSDRPEGSVPYSDEAWDAAPLGSILTTDLQTGEQWISPHPAPVEPWKFLPRGTT